MRVSELTIQERVRSSIRSLISYPCKLYLSIQRKIYCFRFHRTPYSKVIVSLTSWSKRIENVPIVIDSILNNSVLPDLIVLNLSKDEFPGGEQDLPKGISDLCSQQKIQLLWHEGNTKAFKKFLKVLDIYPDDIVIAIDDDFLYPRDFIETFLRKHEECPKYPLSGNRVKVSYTQAHCGCASLIKKEYFGSFARDLIDDKVIEIGQDDIFYTYCVALNGLHYEYVGKDYFINMEVVNPIDGLSKNSSYSCLDMQQYLLEKIKRKYHINMTVATKPFFVV